MSNRERISAVDTAWLRMDRPTNLMMIVGVMMFDTPIDFARLKKTLEARLLRYRRFRQRVVANTTGTVWQDDENFDIERHLHRTALPGDGGKAELQRLAAELIASPLDPSKPLWNFYLVERFNGGSAIVVRIHHCIADGIALIGVMHSLTDESPDATDPPAHAVCEDEDAEENVWNRIFEPITQATVAAINGSTELGIKCIQTIAEPSQLVTLGQHSIGIAGELASLLLMPVDSQTRFKGKPGGTKCVAWSEPMPLIEVKAVGSVLGCSVNDVLLSSVAGALRTYLLEKGDSVEGVELRALVPVNMRSAEDAGKLGNRFGMVTLLLPVGISNPLQRVYEVQRRMAQLKGSYQPVVSLGILGAVGMAPKFIQEKVLDMLAAKATAVMTNVPGAQQTRYMSGAKLAQQMFWVPQSGDVGMGVSILSYAGRVQFGLVIDKRFAPDPEKIVDRFQPEFEKLLYTVLLEPWGELRDPSEIEQSLEQEFGILVEEDPVEPPSATPKRPRKPRVTRTNATPAVSK